MGHAFIKSDGRASPIRFVASNFKNLRVAVQSNYFAIGMSLLDHYSQCTRAAAQIKDALARSNLGLLNQTSLEEFFSHCPSEEYIVKGCQYFPAQSGNI